MTENGEDIAFFGKCYHKHRMTTGERRKKREERKGPSETMVLLRSKGHLMVLLVRRFCNKNTTTDMQTRKEKEKSETQLWFM